VLTRGQLIDRVWGSDYVGDTKTLDVHVKRLRAKLEPDPAEPKYLVTVRGLGYKLDARASPRNASRLRVDSPRKRQPDLRHSHSLRIEEAKPSSRIVLNDSSA
jgi:DNA-binding winged helix-turn-helix (wHTH) protein